MKDTLKELGDTIPPVDCARREGLALVVIDMQYHDAAPDRGLTKLWEDRYPGSMRYYCDRLEQVTVPAIGRLLGFFREEGMTVVHIVLGSEYEDMRDCPPRFRQWTRNLEAETGGKNIWWTKNPDYAVIAPLAPREGETVIRKTTNGAFNGSRIDQILSGMGVDRLIVTGVVTSACVDATARDAGDRGYGCVLVSEACADYDPDLHEATLKALSLGFTRVCEGVDDVIAAVREGRAL